MAELIDSLRTVAEYARSVSTLGQPSAVARWCVEHAEILADERTDDIRVGVELHRLFGNDGWTDDQFAELGAMARREVKRADEVVEQVAPDAY